MCDMKSLKFWEGNDMELYDKGRLWWEIVNMIGKWIVLLALLNHMDMPEVKWCKHGF